jgi:signal transduction histidine kinase
LSSIADQVGIAVENARLYEQARQLAVMEERRRLARDLHDSVTQTLYSLTLFAETGRRFVQRGELETAEANLNRLIETAQRALKEMRLLVYELRPLGLEADGLVMTLQKRLDAVERRAGVKAVLAADGLPELPGFVERDLYHILQEALNNSLKYAGATAVTVEIRGEDGHVRAAVTDDGVGFDVAAARQRGGLGLTSMQERAERLGGELAITAQPGVFTKVAVTFPLPAAGRAGWMQQHESAEDRP